MTSRALVTGGIGFIGSHLVDRLIYDGWEVRIIDSGISGDLRNLNKKAELLCKDLIECREFRFSADVLFHFAAYPIRLEKLGDYETYINQTELGTCAALDIARKNSIRKVVLPASTTLYGRSRIIPTPEDFAGPDPSFYGTSKFNSERWAEAFSYHYGLQVIICRFGRILGPRSRNGSVWDLVYKLRANPNRLEVLGDGTQRRSFLDVTDCVEGMLCALENAKEKVERFNIANRDTASVKELVEILLEEAHVNPEVVYGDEPIGWKGDNNVVFPDTTKLRSSGWRPRLSSKQTIRDCVRWTLRETEKREIFARQSQSQ